MNAKRTNRLAFAPTRWELEDFTIKRISASAKDRQCAPSSICRAILNNSRMWSQLENGKHALTMTTYSALHQGLDLLDAGKTLEQVRETMERYQQKRG